MCRARVRALSLRRSEGVGLLLRAGRTKRPTTVRCLMRPPPPPPNNKQQQGKQRVRAAAGQRQVRRCVRCPMLTVFPHLFVDSLLLFN